MSSAHQNYYRPSYSASWNVLLQYADDVWEQVPEVDFSRVAIIGDSVNSMYVGSYVEDWYGLYTRTSSSSKVSFKIQINSRTIDLDYRRNCSTCWHNFVRSATTHELGHVLDLADNPVAPGKPPGYYLSIMAHNRDRNTVITPYQFDRLNVSARY